MNKKMVKIRWKSTSRRKEYWSDLFRFKNEDVKVIPEYHANRLKKAFPKNIEIIEEEVVKPSIKTPTPKAPSPKEQIPTIEKYQSPHKLKISFFTIAFEAEDFIEGTIQCIYPYAHQILIAEGAIDIMAEMKGYHRSRDKTVEIIQNFPDPERKITLVQKPVPWRDKGEMKDALIKLATGDILFQVDHDERYFGKNIRKVRQILEKNHDIDMVRVGFKNFWKDRNHIIINTRWDDFFYRAWRRKGNLEQKVHWYPHRDGKPYIKPYFKDFMIEERIGFHYGYMRNEQVTRDKLELMSRRDKGYYAQVYKEHLQKWLEGKGDLIKFDGPHPTDKPIILISSIAPNLEGDQVHNGGIKLYNLWIKLIRQHGYEAYFVTRSGKYIPWLIEHQPTISLDQVKKWKEEGKHIKFITGWIISEDFIDVADEIYFYDCEVGSTSTYQFPTLKKYLSEDKIAKIVTNSMHQQKWYQEKLGIQIDIVPEWSDENYWVPKPEERKKGLVGYCDEGKHTQAHLKEIMKECEKANLKLQFMQIFGNEQKLIEQMHQCDYFLGMNIGKYGTGREGCPRTPHESMHTGCIVIAYDVKGNREYLKDGETGFIVLNGNAKAMADKLIFLEKHKDIKEKIRKKSLDFISENFTSKGKWKYIAKFLDLQCEAPPPTTKQAVRKPGIGGEIVAMPHKHRRRMIAAIRREEYRDRFSLPLSELLLQFNTFSPKWMGVGMQKNPLDLMQYQEIMWKLKPDILIEIGSLSGGSTLFFANIMDIIGKGKVISIDKDRSRYKIKHPKITEITGDSSSPEVVSKVEALCAGQKVIMVNHDGDHHAEQVIKDLRLYCKFVTIGSYFIVEDTVLDLFTSPDKLGAPWPAPMCAVEQFIKENKNFVIDEDQECYLATSCVKGYLRRIQ